MAKRKSVAELEAELEKMATTRKELNNELRRAKRREEAEAARLKAEEDRKEADALLEAVRALGIPDGESVEYVSTYLPSPIVENDTNSFSETEDSSDFSSDEFQYVIEDSCDEESAEPQYA